MLLHMAQCKENIHRHCEQLATAENESITVETATSDAPDFRSL